MKKHITRIATALILIAAQLLILSACAVSPEGVADNGLTTDAPNGTTGTQPTLDSPPTTEDGADIITEFDRSLFYGETLTIAVLVDSFIRPIADRFMYENPGVRIEIISFNSAFFDRDLDTPRMQMAVKLMAGSGPVLIESWILDTLDPRIFPFMVDWFTVMAADPDFNEDDWFMNVFHALSIDGRLYQFPFEFLYDSVSINSAISHLPDVLSERSSVSLSEMMQIYQEFTAESPKIIAPNFSPSWLVSFYLGDFLDMEASIVDFDNQRFIDFISNALNAKDNIGVRGFTAEEEAQVLSDYIFSISPPGESIRRFLDFTIGGSLFTGAIPLVDADGNIIIDANTSFVLNAVNSTPAQQALAWDFMKFMMTSGNQPVHQIFHQHVNRELMLHSAERLFHHNLEFFHHLGWQLAVTEEEALEQVIERMTAIGEMPMARRGSAAPDLIRETIFEALQMFEDGLATAEQTAQHLQDRISLIMMEMGFVNS